MSRVPLWQIGGKIEPPASRQVGGTHYQSMAIQPIDFITQNGLGFCEGNALKYLCRHREKGKAEDLRKAIHYLELLIEHEYGERP